MSYYLLLAAVAVDYRFMQWGGHEWLHLFFEHFQNPDMTRCNQFTRIRSYDKACDGRTSVVQCCTSWYMRWYHFVTSRIWWDGGRATLTCVLAICRDQSCEWMWLCYMIMRMFQDQSQLIVQCCTTTCECMEPYLRVINRGTTKSFPMRSLTMNSWPLITI